jgi:ABC-2 type transport system permease protein
MMVTDTIKLYFRYIGISIRSQMQYKASFIMSAIGHLMITFIEFLGMWALFDRFGSLRGWSLAEVALFYGIVHTAFAITEAISRGFDIFPAMVKSGDFDRYLLRPRGTIFQLISQELQMMRIGRFLQGLVILIWAATTLDIDWNVARVLLTIGSILGGACIFSGFFVLQATMSFWTTETLEIVNTITYGGVETAQFPLMIYRDWFRKFFTFVVPLALINFFPALAILDRPDPYGVPELIKWGSPVLGFVFLLVTLQIWKIGERHYTSTGS